jgi:hypothetical protein
MANTRVRQFQRLKRLILVEDILFTPFDVDDNEEKTTKELADGIWHTKQMLPQALPIASHAFMVSHGFLLLHIAVYRKLAV